MTARAGRTYRRAAQAHGRRTAGSLPAGPRSTAAAGLDPLAQKIVLEELWLAEAPFPFVTVNTIGPALIRRGTRGSRSASILPRIASGELNFAVGYSEAQAGTDLAALQTQAVRDGEFFVINGQKVFTSGAEGADYIWLAARTDADAPAHRGISIIMVDTRLPGFAVSPIHTVGGIRTNVTYYQDVRVPVTMLVGELNGGWQLITEQLNHERVGLAALAYGAQGCFDDTLAWARATRAAARLRHRPAVGADRARRELRAAAGLRRARQPRGLGSGPGRGAGASWQAPARCSAPRSTSACCGCCWR